MGSNEGTELGTPDGSFVGLIVTDGSTDGLSDGAAVVVGAGVPNFSITSRNVKKIGGTSLSLITSSPFAIVAWDKIEANTNVVDNSFIMFR